MHVRILLRLHEKKLLYTTLPAGFAMCTPNKFLWRQAKVGIDFKCLRTSQWYAPPFIATC